MSTIQIAPPRRSALDEGARERPTVKTVIATIPYMFFLVANIFDMGGTHGLKYTSYLLLAVLLLFAHKPLRLSGTEALGIAALFFVWPLFSFSLGMLNGAELKGANGAQSQATPFLAFFVALLVVPILGSQRVLRHLYSMYLIMGAIALTLSTLMYLNLGMGFITHIAEYCSAGYSAYGGGIMDHRIYFQATLWLVPTAVYFAKTSRFPFAVLCLTALIVSGSKAGAVIAFVFIGWILLSVRKYRTFGIISMAIGVAVGLFLLPAFLQITQDAFLDPNASAISVRYGHATSVFQVFVDKPWTLFIGNGAGATFFSNGTGNWEVRQETDHLDAIFHYGILWFGAFTFLCAQVIRRLLGSGQVVLKAHGLALLSMYIAAGTNPQLISPLFMFYLGTCYMAVRRLPRSKRPRGAIRIEPGGPGFPPRRVFQHFPTGA